MGIFYYNHDIRIQLSSTQLIQIIIIIIISLLQTILYKNNDLIQNNIPVQLDDDIINMITIMNTNLDIYKFTITLTNYSDSVTGKL